MDSLSSFSLNSCFQTLSKSCRQDVSACLIHLSSTDTYTLKIIIWLESDSDSSPSIAFDQILFKKLVIIN
jgi:hypothetical protein